MIFRDFEQQDTSLLIAKKAFALALVWDYYLCGLQFFAVLYTHVSFALWFFQPVEGFYKYAMSVKCDNPGGEISKTALVTTANITQKINIKRNQPTKVSNTSTLQIKSKILFFTCSQILDIPIFWRCVIVAAIFF